jgi:hypothetical protein
VVEREPLDRYGKDLGWWNQEAEKLEEHNKLRAEQKRSGPTTNWSVASEYWVENNRVMEGGNPERASSYNVMAHLELPGRLADLADGNTKAVLAFYRKWGRLGYDKMALNGEPGQSGEPVEWVIAHAKTVRMMLELINLPEENTEEHFAEYVRQRLIQFGDPEFGTVGTFGLVPGVGLIFFPAWDGRLQGAYHLLMGPLSTRENILDNVVMPVLQDNCRGIHAFPVRSGWVRAHDSLIAGIYGHLAEVAIGNLVYYQCAYRKCGKWNPIAPGTMGPKLRYCQAEGPEPSFCARRETYYRAKDLAKARKATSAASA